jgi:hypothetical protein
MQILIVKAQEFLSALVNQTFLAYRLFSWFAERHFQLLGLTNVE